MVVAQTSDAFTSAGPWLFYPIAGLAVAGALGVVFSQQIVRMAVALLFTLASVALLYFYLAAEFLAAIQLIVYVGGILILIIFGVMLTSKNPFVSLSVPLNQRLLGWSIGATAAILMGLVSVLAIDAPIVERTESFDIRNLGEALLSKYVLPFELAGVLLLIVMIGAAYIAKGRHEDAPNNGGEASS